MARVISNILTYEAVCEKVLEHDTAITQMDPEFKHKQVVVPGTDRDNPMGTPGIVAMYNESSGLRLDGQNRLCIASATKEEIAAGESHNKPIVPETFAYAMAVNTFKGLLNSATEEDNDKAPSIGAVKSFIGNRTIGFHETPVAPGNSFEITSGMLAIISPAEGSTLLFSSPENNGALQATGQHGLTILYASDKGGEEWDTNNEFSRMLFIWLDGVLSSTNNNVYSGSVTVTNKHSTRNAYVFYLSSAIE